MAYPLIGGEPRVVLTGLTVALFFAASVVHALITRGPAWTVLLVLVTGGGGLVAEAVGLRTGLPFGSYRYGPALGPAVLSVPIVVPLAWTMMAYPAHVIAARLVHGRIARVLVGGWALAAWDLFLDPQMVAAGNWRWQHPAVTLPGNPAVPLGNYLGWLVVATAMMGLLVAGAAAVRERPASRDGAPIALYLWTYFSSVLAHGAFFHLPWSALWGGVIMGCVAVPLARSLLVRRTTCAR